MEASVAPNTTPITAERFAHILATAIRVHQQMEAEYDKVGDWRHSLDENHTVSALIAVRNECGL